MPRSDPAPHRPAWYFPEYTPVGIDLGSTSAVAAYDRNQGTDPDADDALLDRLEVAEGSHLVDLACGTGSLAVQAARRGAVAHGVDVSEEMLASAQARSERFGVAPHWHHAGFLDYSHSGPLVDVVTTKSALHQLPDFWKQQALLKAAGMLRPGGTFYLWDVIFAFGPTSAEEHLQQWIDTEGRPEGRASPGPTSKPMSATSSPPTPGSSRECCSELGSTSSPVLLPAPLTRSSVVAADRYLPIPCTVRPDVS